VDQTGILAELYTQAQFAFVGGSFKKTVHSVMEPLAAGCVTFVGPKHQNNREALAIKNVKLKSLNGEAAVIAVNSPADWDEKLKSFSKLNLSFVTVKAEIKALITERSGFALAKALEWLEAQLK
jgi:3-deoxy-D-manno-octulosonic-acid transferase